MTIAQLILAFITQAPSALSQITSLYEAVKADIGSDDQAQIDAALAAEQAKLAPEQAQTDADLESAAKE
jgi:hypothetical protein